MWDEVVGSSHREHKEHRAMDREREGVGSENVAKLQARASESEGRLILDHREIHFRPAADAF